MPARDFAIQEVGSAMEALRIGVLAEMDRRNLNATGAMAASVDPEVTQDAEATVGTLSALDYWVRVGSGTPPGGPVFVDDIQKWIDAKGLDLSAWAVARRIRRTGSKDFREGNPNAFETAIDQWEASALMQGLGERTANQYGDSFVEILRNNIQN